MSSSGGRGGGEWQIPGVGGGADGDDEVKARGAIAKTFRFRRFVDAVVRFASFFFPSLCGFLFFSGVSCIGWGRRKSGEKATVSKFLVLSVRKII